jgi:hypothetical protein
LAISANSGRPESVLRSLIDFISCSGITELICPFKRSF